MGGWAPGYGSTYMGIAYQSTIDTIPINADRPPSRFIASPSVTPTSKPLDNRSNILGATVTAAQQDQDAKTVLNPDFAQAGSVGAELGGPAPIISDIANALPKFLFFGVLVLAFLAASTAVVFKRV